MRDRRERFATERVAAEELRGRVEAPAFVAPWRASVAPPSAFLHAAPGGSRDREMLHGDHLDLIEDRGGWTFGRAVKDGYCGWIEEGDLGPAISATHSVGIRHAHLYGVPDFRTPPAISLPFGARVRVDQTDGRWAETSAGWIFADHLRHLSDPAADPVSVAEIFVGTPYLWAGNTGIGIDCSGLVQVACLACGIGCPGDSDQQERALGHALADTEPPARGDLVFWRGHVAWVVSADTILHANAHAMKVTFEPLGSAIARIEAQGDGPVTSRRRL